MPALNPTSLPPRTAEQRWAYALLRLLLGVNLFGHGLIRVLHGTGAFAAALVHQMAASPLPPGFVAFFGYVLPWCELALGILLILGLLSRWTLPATMLLLTALMFGITLKQDWPVAGLQLVYGVVVFALLVLRETYESPWWHLFQFPSRRS